MSTTPRMPLLPTTYARPWDTRRVMFPKAAPTKSPRNEYMNTMHLQPRGFRKQPVLPPLELPSGFGPYRVVEPLGQGGMSQVYRASDDRLGREVALKVSAPGLLSGSRGAERFARE